MLAGLSFKTPNEVFVGIKRAFALETCNSCVINNYYKRIFDTLYLELKNQERLS